MTETQKYSTEFKRLLKERKSFLLLMHSHPDGDALGACCGLAFVLKKMKKQVTIGLCEPLPARYEFLTRDDALRFAQQERIQLARYDTVIALDASTPNRLGKFASGIVGGQESVLVVNIDHHAENTRFGAANIIDDGADSTAQMVIELVGARSLDANAAFCLYTGMLYNTGAFQYGKNLRRVHESAMACLSWPIDPKYVYRRLFALETEASLKLFSRALSRLLILDKGRIASIYLSHEDYREFKGSPAHSTGFIDRLVMIDGAQVVLFFNEIDDNIVKISLRSSTDFSVGDFAELFGGGGHPHSAACTTEGILAKVIERTLRALRVAMEHADKRTD